MSPRRPIRTGDSASARSDLHPMKGFRALAFAQWVAFIRDRQVLFWMMAFPLFFLLLFGALNSGSGGDTSKADVIEVGKVAFVDHLPADAKKQWEGLFDVTRTSDRSDALDQVKKGDADAMIEQRGDRLVLHYSNADQVKAATVRGTMSGFVDKANLAASGAKTVISLDPESVEDDSLKAIQYLTPGLLGFALAMGGTFGGAMTLVNWRKTQMLRRLRLTPTGTGALIGARVVVSLAIAAAQFVLFVLVAKLLFGLELTGSWYLAFPIALAGMLVFMAIGLIAGAVSKSEEAASGLANLIVLPMSFLGGAFIPLDEAPGWLRTVANVLPMGHVTDGMTDVMVRGLGWSAAWQPLAILLGFALVFAVIAAKLFRWED